MTCITVIARGVHVHVLFAYIQSLKRDFGATYFTEVANVLSGHSFIFNSAVLKDRFASKNGLLSHNNWKLCLQSGT